MRQEKLVCEVELKFACLSCLARRGTFFPDECSFLASRAAIAQLGERQTEDLKVPGSIPGLGNGALHANNSCVVNAAVSSAEPE